MCEVEEVGHVSNVFAFLGSYSEKEEYGVWMCRFNPATGEMTVTDRVTGLKNPTFLDVDPVRKVLYVLAEEETTEGGRSSIGAAYRIDPAAGTLTELNQEYIMNASLCHIHLDRTRGCLFTASYHKGMVGVSPVLEDGRIGPTAQVLQHEGSSIHPAQTQARAHSVFPDPANGYALVCDLGMDRIVSYRIDTEAPKLIPGPSAALEPGAGPRHLAFHPTLPYGYVINELNSTISVFSYEADTGRLTPVQNIPTLPEGYAGESATADIHVSPDGRFVYGSNRGHDSIAVFAVDAGSGRLSLIGHTSTEGGHPRNFALSPDGRLLVAANRDGNNLVVFSRDEASGLLKPNGQQLAMSKPVCIKFGVFTD